MIQADTYKKRNVMAPSFFTGTKVIGAKSMKEMVATLKKPRRVMMLVKAGSAVDAFIDQLVSLYKLFCCSTHHSA